MIDCRHCGKQFDTDALLTIHLYETIASLEIDIAAHECPDCEESAADRELQRQEAYD